MKVYDQTGNIFKRFALQRKDFKVEEKLDNGMIKRQLSFTYPLEDGRIFCEELITYEGERYRVKEAPVKGRYGSVVAAQDTDALSGHCIENFTAAGMTLEACVGRLWREPDGRTGTFQRTIWRHGTSRKIIRTV